jgi:hypothetical protein
VEADFVMFTDLDTSTVRPDRAAIFAVEFLVWWHQVGRECYGRGEDDGVKAFAREAVLAVGGWRPARRLLRDLDVTTRILIEAKGVL